MLFIDTHLVAKLDSFLRHTAKNILERYGAVLGPLGHEPTQRPECLWRKRGKDGQKHKNHESEYVLYNG